MDGREREPLLGKLDDELIHSFSVGRHSRQLCEVKFNFVIEIVGSRQVFAHAHGNVFRRRVRNRDPFQNEVENNEG